MEHLLIILVKIIIFQFIRFFKEDFTMNRNIKRLLSAFLALFLLTSIVGCSKKSPETASVKQSWNAEASRGDVADAKSKVSVQYNEPVDANGAMQYDQAPEADSATALTGTGEASKAYNNNILNERKIIRNANITVEVDNFDTAYGKIEYIIGNIGYIQESKISKVKHYVDNKEVLSTNGVITIRVDADKFSSVLKDIKGLGLLTDENIKTDDVTEKFFDIESRLRLIRYEESRLEEYLKKISDPDTIFKTERRLTEIRVEIEQLTGNLNKLSDLVKLSTITINMNEKLPKSLSTPVKPSYWGKLKDNFLGSLGGVVDFLGNLLIFIVAAFPVLLLLALIFFAVFFIYKKVFKRRFRKVQQASTTDENDIEG